MQYQFPAVRPPFKQAPSTAPPKSPDFNEPVLANFDPTTWLNRNVLYYPTVTNNPPIAKFIEPRIDFDPTGWMSRTSLYYPTRTNPPPIPTFLNPMTVETSAFFDATAWMNRGALPYPTTTAKSFQVLFLEPRIYFDNGQAMIQGTLVIISPTGAAVVTTPLRMRMGMGL
jgi:hypothetical protein